MSCMYEQLGEGSYLTSSLAALSEVPCMSLQGGAPLGHSCLVLKRSRERNPQIVRGTTYQGLPVAREGMSLVPDPVPYCVT